LNHGTRELSSRTAARAVARSRAVRAAVARRRRRRIALAAGLGAMLCAPVAWWMAEPAAAVAAATIIQVEDLAELLSQRSPGVRTQDQLTKHARVAAKIRPAPKPAVPLGHPTAPDVPSATELIDLLQPQPVPVEIASANLPPVLAEPPTLESIFNSTPGFSPPGDSSGGGGHVSFPSSEPREAIPPVSAVPEPGTWAMMLMGFGLVAWRVRRKPRPAGSKAIKRSVS